MILEKATGSFLIVELDREWSRFEISYRKGWWNPKLGVTTIKLYQVVNKGYYGEKVEEKLIQIKGVTSAEHNVFVDELHNSPKLKSDKIKKLLSS